MFTYGYHVKIEGGPVVDAVQKKQLADYMQSMSGMTFGPDAASIPKARFTVESVSLESNPDGRITDITIHMNMPMLEWCHEDAGEWIADLAEEAWYEIASDESANIMAKGPLNVLGREGEMPDKLYHITDKDGAEKIKEEGLYPTQGKNSYKNYEDFVYLTDLEQLPVWMGILKEPDDAVILEVDPVSLKNLERGRTFYDREYTKPFSEYRTREPISAACIKKAEFSVSEQDGLYETIQGFLEKADENKDEVKQAAAILQNIVIGNFVKDFAKTLDSLDRLRIQSSK